MSEKEDPFLQRPNGEFRMLVSFVDQSESFCNGWEAGAMWSLMAKAPRQFEFDTREYGLPLHTANVEMFERIANALGYDLEWFPVDETWIDCRVSPSQGAFRVIEGGNA